LNAIPVDSYSAVLEDLPWSSIAFGCIRVTAPQARGEALDPLAAFTLLVVYQLRSWLQAMELEAALDVLASVLVENNWTEFEATTRTLAHSVLTTVPVNQQRPLAISLLKVEARLAPLCDCLVVAPSLKEAQGQLEALPAHTSTKLALAFHQGGDPSLRLIVPCTNYDEEDEDDDDGDGVGAGAVLSSDSDLDVDEKENGKLSTKGAMKPLSLVPAPPTPTLPPLVFKAKPTPDVGSTGSLATRAPFFPVQELNGQRLLAVVVQELGGLDAMKANYTQIVAFCILVPPMNSLYEQTVARLASSGILFDLGLVGSEEEALSRERAATFVVKAHRSEEAAMARFWGVVDQEASREGPRGLCVLVHDEAHWAIGRVGAKQPKEGGEEDLETGGAICDRFLNRAAEKDVKRNPISLMRILVTATPYALQTNRSRIKPTAEVPWQDDKPQGIG
jgi:hypothetical protein